VTKILFHFIKCCECTKNSVKKSWFIVAGCTSWTNSIATQFWNAQTEIGIKCRRKETWEVKVECILTDAVRQSIIPPAEIEAFQYCDDTSVGKHEALITRCDNNGSIHHWFRTQRTILYFQLRAINSWKKSKFNSVLSFYCNVIKYCNSDTELSFALTLLKE
jgi:hypothetical protein